MKIKVLKQLIEHLEKQLDSPAASRFNMEYFGNSINYAQAEMIEKPVCGTQACLAGETVLTTGAGFLRPFVNGAGGGIELKSGLNFLGDIEEQATRDLGLTYTQQKNLFYLNDMLREEESSLGMGWPEKFGKAYKDARTPQGRLYVAIRRIEHFIKTKGRE